MWIWRVTPNCWPRAEASAPSAPSTHPASTREGPGLWGCIDKSQVSFSAAAHNGSISHSLGTKMQIPVQIQLRGLAPSDALEASAREHAHKLETFAPDIMSCRVAIELAQKHQHQGRPYGVHIDLTLPGRELVANRVPDDDVYVALRDAFDSMKRQIEDVVRQRRGDEKQHAVPLHGEVVRLDGEGGFGLTRTPDGNEQYSSRDNHPGMLF